MFERLNFWSARHRLLPTDSRHVSPEARARTHVRMRHVPSRDGAFSSVQLIRRWRFPRFGSAGSLVTFSRDKLIAYKAQSLAVRVALRTNARLARRTGRCISRWRKYNGLRARVRIEHALNTMRRALNNFIILISKVYGANQRDGG